MTGDYIRRYTDLTALIYLLRRRNLTLLDPSSWDDSNDSYYSRCTRKSGSSNLFWRSASRRPTRDITIGGCSPLGRAVCVSDSADLGYAPRVRSMRACK